jgi:hypothetical protein
MNFTCPGGASRVIYTATGGTPIILTGNVTSSTLDAGCQTGVELIIYAEQTSTSSTYYVTMPSGFLPTTFTPTTGVSSNMSPAAAAAVYVWTGSTGIFLSAVGAGAGAF